MTWEQVDDLVTWLVGQLGDGLVAAIDDAEVVFGPLSDDERHRVRSRHKELPPALASLRRRDRQQPLGLLPAEERRAITLGLFARICADRNVGGWQERLERVINADDAQYRSAHFEFECASLLTWQSVRKVDFVSEDEPGKTCEMRIDGLVDVECKRLQGRSQLDRQTADLWRRLEQKPASIRSGCSGLATRCSMPPEQRRAMMAYACHTEATQLYEKMLGKTTGRSQSVAADIGMRFNELADKGWEFVQRVSVPVAGTIRKSKEHRETTVAVFRRDR